MILLCGGLGGARLGVATKGMDCSRAYFMPCFERKLMLFTAVLFLRHGVFAKTRPVELKISHKTFPSKLKYTANSGNFVEASNGFYLS